MGAWGVKTLENDIALDWLAELEDEKDLSLVVVKFLNLYEEYANEELIDSDLSSEVLAAAEVVSALLGLPSPELSKELVKWLEKKTLYDRNLVSIINEIIKVTEFENDFKSEWKKYSKDQKWSFVLESISNYAKNSIDIILERSELKELWQETDDYANWVEEINSLKQRCERIESND